MEIRPGALTVHEGLVFYVPIHSDLANDLGVKLLMSPKIDVFPMFNNYYLVVANSKRKYNLGRGRVLVAWYKEVT